MIKSTKAFQAEFQKFLQETRDKNLWLGPPGGPYFSPDQLEAEITEGRYMYEPEEYQFIDPVDLLADVQKEIRALRDKIESIKHAMVDEIDMLAEHYHTLRERVDLLLSQLDNCVIPWNLWSQEVKKAFVPAVVKYLSQHLFFLKDYPDEVVYIAVYREVMNYGV